MVTDPLVISGWGVLSPIGIGLEAFSAGLAANQPASAPVPGAAERRLPCTAACTIPAFDAVTYLGPKRTRSLDRVTALSVAATGMALADSGLPVTPDTEARIGVVLGTSNGSLRSACEFTRDTFVHVRPYDVSPELFPNTVMNCAAGQCAIWHRLRAVNTTISGARLAGVLALRYASRVIRGGYADALVAGAAEEFSDEMAWGAYHASNGVLGRD